MIAPFPVLMVGSTFLQTAHSVSWFQLWLAAALAVIGFAGLFPRRQLLHSVSKCIAAIKQPKKCN